MWIVVYMAQERGNAEKMRDLLEQHEILARLREVSEESFEVLVPSTELEQAQEIIIS